MSAKWKSIKDKIDEQRLIEAFSNMWRITAEEFHWFPKATIDDTLFTMRKLRVFERAISERENE